jgi:hypothetical protein
VNDRITCQPIWLLFTRCQQLRSRNDLLTVAEKTWQAIFSATHG